MRNQGNEESRSILGDLSKIISYSILGNAPSGVQNWTEDKFGIGVFNAADASRTSCWTNLALYGGAFGLAKYFSQEGYFDPIMFDHNGISAQVGLLGVLLGIAEREVRQRIGLPCASLPGKILSVPFEFGKFVYEKLRN